MDNLPPTNDNDISDEDLNTIIQATGQNYLDEINRILPQQIS